MSQVKMTSPTIGVFSKVTNTSTLKIERWGKRFDPYFGEETNLYLDGENVLWPNYTISSHSL